MIQSFALLLVAIFGLFLPVLIQHKTDAHQKLAASCVVQPRANAADHAKGSVQRASVEQCGDGATTAKTAAVLSRGTSTNGAASALPMRSRTTAVETPRMHRRQGRNHARPRLESAGPAMADRRPGF